MDGTLEKLRKMTAYDIEVLPNGTKLLTQYRPGLSTNIAVMFSYGTAYEKPEKQQAAHFAEHMMFKKGKREAYRTRLEELEHMSANGYNATTAFEHIALGSDDVFVASPKNAPKLIRLIGQMLDEEEIEDESFEAERKIVLHEQLPKEKSESYAFMIKANALFWGSEHPYVLAMRPNVENIKHLTQTDIHEVFGYLKGENVVISIVGCYDNMTLQAAREIFGMKHCTRRKNEIPDTETRMEEIRLEQSLSDLSTPQATISFRLPGTGHDDLAIARILSQYLDDSSQLFRRFRDETQLCYNVTSDINQEKKGSTFQITAQNFLEDDKDKIIGLMKQEVSLLKEGNIDEVLLERKREKAEEAAIQYESSRRTAKSIAKTEIFKIKSVYEFVQGMMNTSAADLQTFAQRYFNYPLITVATPRR